MTKPFSTNPRPGLLIAVLSLLTALVRLFDHLGRPW
jgi:hypothetical protein